jgi:hypothetical protein
MILTKLILIVLNILLLIYAWLISFGFLADTSPREQNLALTYACVTGGAATMNLWGVILCRYFWSNGRAWVYGAILINCAFMIGLPLIPFAFGSSHGIEACYLAMIEAILLLNLCFVAFGRSPRRDRTPSD